MVAEPTAAIPVTAADGRALAAVIRRRALAEAIRRLAAMAVELRTAVVVRTAADHMVEADTAGVANNLLGASAS